MSASELNGKVIDITPAMARYRVQKVETKLALDAHWPFLRKGLLDIKERCAEAKIRWEPEHVRWEIMRGQLGQSGIELFLVLTPPDDEIVGFFITTTNLDPFLHVPLDFEVWLTWGCGEFLIRDVDAQIEELARARGCTAVEGKSPRLEWGRKLMPLGYQLRYACWRKELS